MARRSAHGVLLPGVVFTLLACAGVLLLLFTGTPVVEQITGRAASGGGPRPRGVPVPPSPSARPSAPRGTATAPSPRPAETTEAPRASARPTRPAPSSPPAPTRPPAPVPPAPRCAAGSATVTAVADAYVDQAMPSRAFGGADTLLVASRDKARNRRALVRFALPPLPAGCTLRSATLTLSARDASGRRVLASRVGRGWNEPSVTWATAPGAAGPASATTVSGATASWSVTAQVAAMRAYGNYGFLLRDAVEGAKNVPQSAFAARGGRRGPTLTLRWS